MTKSTDVDEPHPDRQINRTEQQPENNERNFCPQQCFSARIEVNQPDLAVGLYEYVMENGYPKAMTVVARVRLARVLLDQGEAGLALTVLDDVEDITGFEARFAEVRGDIHYDQGRMDEAAAAYLDALDLLEAGAGDRSKLVMKLESMGAEIPEDGSES